MPTYAIGDVQGCCDELCSLLAVVGFDRACDRLILLGDLVNRGPDSLGVLRTVRDLGSAAVTVLGNHDLHLLAVAQGGRAGRRDTLQALLAAPDRDALIDWLRAQPLAHHDAQHDVLFVHAGIAPQWSTADVLQLAAEASARIRGPQGARFLSRMYGDHPDTWSPRLRGAERTRFVVNCLTRARYCDAQGRLDLRFKGRPGTQPAGLLPWFQVPGRRTATQPVVFGHWSTLGQVHWPEHRVSGLDTGCVWGGTLTALRLDDGQLFQVPGRAYSEHD